MDTRVSLHTLLFESTFALYFCSGAKLAFPFDWMTSLDCLNETTFPSREHFFSTLKQKGISDEEYQKLVTIYNENCETMGEYLDLYAKADVQEFPACILNVVKFYNEFGLCPVNDSISIPSLSISLMEKLTDPSTVWFLPSQNASDLLVTLRKGIVGGLSEVWTRLHVGEGMTQIRGGTEKTARIIGWDCSAMYLVSLIFL